MVLSSITIALLTFLAYKSWRMDAAKRLILTPLTLFCVYYILRVVPGFAVGVNARDDVDDTYIIALVLAFLGFLGGYFLIRGSPLRRVWGGLAACLEDRESHFRRPIYFFLGILLMAGFALYGGLPPAIDIAIDATTMSVDARDVASAVAEARREISKGHIFDENSQGSGVFREVIFSAAILSIACAATYLFARPNWVSAIFFALCLLSSYVFVSGDGTRGRFIVVATGALVAYSLLRRIRLRHVLLSAVLLVALAVLLGAYTNKMVHLVSAGDWAGILWSVLERIFVGNSINDATAISAVNSGYIEMGYGSWLIRDLLAILPGVGVDKPLAYYLYLYEVGGWSTTYLTGTALSRAYADGGLPALVLYFGALGALTKQIDLPLSLLPGKFPGSTRVSFTCALWLVASQGYVSGIAGIIFLALLCYALMFSYQLTLIRFRFART